MVTEELLGEAAVLAATAPVNGIPAGADGVSVAPRVEGGWSRKRGRLRRPKELAEDVAQGGVLIPCILSIVQISDRPSSIRMRQAAS